MESRRMSVIKQAPNQPYLETQGKFEWENEETLVDQRNSLRNRISRLIRSVWLWVLIIGIFVLALLDASVMRAFISIMSVVLELLLFIGLAVSQFVLMFWFMARSCTYTIMPGAEGISFKDYRGQPEILEQAQQV